MNFLQSRNNKRNNSIQAQATTDHVHRTRELRRLRAYLAGMSKTERKVTVVCHHRFISSTSRRLGFF
jgi:hypothetical protein